ncbi:EAL domain-containing protein [Celerinatantimonas diazotrophica]|uniref:PAS domain S-box-containing protein/diguanylate cyclase (GGDEF)-like protein n=1 Tax=Celerinatantimonas diazotrophica TaxID=412034 RepID=A0A4R1J9G7_9GAMM|nr:EAL domain-containing protein [Celerinatantimonas diazotrophica]TCK47253.1 PAS domain S-box-containing protein/diguanylate cyclase (GGDEF)-like protein [Celerinatantimonas diazotrophica]CAG9296025.1 Protein-glutamate methylesterase/protein-glutamine glutaminase [Celerinatantimonas diazotrophica]
MTNQQSPKNVVGIGASAGGLAALRELICKLSVDLDAAIIIAQHLSPTYKSLLTELLQKETPLVVSEAKMSQSIQNSHIYVCPSDYDIEIKQGQLELIKTTRKISPKPSVDRLFASIAKEYPEHCIGIILSGTGTDGAKGVVSIQNAGGLVICQDPKTAEYDSMPDAAITQANIERVFPAAQIGDQLNELIHSDWQKMTVQKSSADGHSEPLLEQLLQGIWHHSQIDFSGYKTATLIRQSERRMTLLQLDNLGDYVRYIRQHNEEYENLIRAFLICVTEFFRDKDAFKTMEKCLKNIKSQKQPGEKTRIWVPGCATGEEAYSIAMLWDQINDGDIQEYPIQIFATDLDEQSVNFARKGIYSPQATDKLPTQLTERYFDNSDPEKMVIDRTLQEMTIFSKHDLIQDPPFLKLDMISCRNVMIYFKNELQQNIFNNFHYALNEQGVLILGVSEVYSGENDYFTQATNERFFIRNNFTHSRLNRIAHYQTELIPNNSVKKKKEAISALQKHLIEQYAPPSVLVSHHNQIIETYGELNSLLRFPSGQVDYDIFNLIPQEHRAELRALLFKLSKNGTEVVSPIYHHDKKHHQLRINRLYPKDPQSPISISFEPPQTEEAITSDKPQQSIDDYSEQQITILQDELSNTREHLQSVVEQLESSNEELQSLNEELQSSSEELQASNEQLTTSNEELQATNEELSSVNDELDHKSRSLSNALDDLINIQNAASVAIVVVDLEFRIKRVNAVAGRTIGILESDINRDFSTLSLRLPLESITKNIARVISAKRVPNMEIDNGQSQLQVSIQPYRSQNGDILGAVLTFSDISNLKAHEAALKEINQLFEDITQSTAQILWIQEPMFGRMRYVSPACSTVLGLDPVMLLRDSEYIFKIMTSKDARHYRQEHMNSHNTPWSFRFQIIHPIDGAKHWLESRIFPVANKEGEILYLSGITYDITQEIEQKIPDIGLDSLFDILVDQSDDLILGVDQDLTIQLISQTDQELSQYKDQSPESFLTKAQWAYLQHQLRDKKSGRKKFICPNKRHKTPPADHFEEVIITTEPLQTNSKYAALIVLKHKKASLPVSKKNQLVSEVFNSTRDGMLILDDEGLVLTANPSALRILNKREENLIGQKPNLFRNVNNTKVFSDDIIQALESDHHWFGEVHVKTTHNDFVTLEVELTELNKTHADDEGRYTVVFTDITERRSFEETIYRQANFDTLTELPNRALLIDRLNTELKHAEREQTSLTLMFIDLDRFKEVNDSLGHEAGDELLVLVTQRITQLIRKSDTLSRFGGDEFILLMPKYHRDQAPEIIAKSILHELDHAFTIKGKTIFISASIGISVYPQDGLAASELLSNADAAMYQAKSSGRHNFAYFQPQMNQDAALRVSLEAELRQAIKDTSLIVYYQPILAAKTRQIVGMEALVRWQHPKLGILPPNEFIPYAEEIGLILPITRLVLEDVVTQMNFLKQHCEYDIPISVNFSPKLLRDIEIEELFNDIQADLSWLTVEVTESVFIGNTVLVLKNINWLKSKGALIALDDFGTGYSSLSYIRKFPVDIIKIDREFVTEAHAKKRDEALVEGTVKMAHGIGSIVVAEGVEQEEQAVLMEHLGVDRMQGYLFSKPVPMREIDSKFLH